MSRLRMESKDPDMRASLQALRRAARRARELGERTGTPVYVIQDGKIIDLTKRKLPPAKRRERRKGGQVWKI